MDGWGNFNSARQKKPKKQNKKKIEKIKTKQGSHGFKRKKKIMIVFGEKKRSCNCFRSPTCIR